MFGIVGVAVFVGDFEVQMRGDGHPVSGVGTAAGLAHAADVPAAADDSADGNFDAAQMSVEGEEAFPAGGPAVFDDDVEAERRCGFVGAGFADMAIGKGEDFVVAKKDRFFAGIFGLPLAVGKQDGGGAPGGARRDGGDVAATVEAASAVARPSGPAIVGVGARAGEKKIGRGEKAAVRRGPVERERLARGQRLKCCGPVHAGDLNRRAGGMQSGFPESAARQFQGLEIWRGGFSRHWKRRCGAGGFF